MRPHYNTSEFPLNFRETGEKYRGSAQNRHHCNENNKDTSNSNFVNNDKGKCENKSAKFR